MAIPLQEVSLGDGVVAAFSGHDRDAARPPVGEAGNLSFRRPHRPGDLAADRRQVAERLGVPVARWHGLRQVHGTAVARVSADTPPGVELGPADAVVTEQPDRLLQVLVADCVPVLVAGERHVGAAHAGRAGVAADVCGALVAELVALGERPARLRAAVGPAICGRCYEVPEAMQREVVGVAPAAAATTRWGTAGLDLPGAVAARLGELGVGEVQRAGRCTYEDEAAFSHRRDPGTGRQAGLIARRAS